MQGNIKRLNERGFGFIVPAGSPPGHGDHFFHATDLNGVTFDSLQVGQRVQFDSFNESKGLVAKNVQPAEHGA